MKFKNHTDIFVQQMATLLRWCMSVDITEK